MALLGLIVLWAGTMFFHLYRFTFSAIDSWAYFAPAVFAKGPGDLNMPLLGAFEGSHAWGLNWPGGLLIDSLFVPFLPKIPVLYTLLHIAEWFAVSCATAAWVRTRTPGTLPVIAAFFLALFDRNLFDIAWFERHEFFCCLAVLGVVYGLWKSREGEKGKTPYALPVLGLSFFLLPLLQPTLLLAGGVLLFLLFVFHFWQDRKKLTLRSVPGVLWLSLISYVFGIGGFFLYYRPGSEVLASLLDHLHSTPANAHSDGRFFFGKTFLLRMLEPGFFSENLVFLGALAACAVAAGRAIRSRTFPKAWSPFSLTAVFFLALLAFAQSTQNAFYMVLATPFSIALCCWGIMALEGKGRPMVLLVLFVVLGSLQTVYYIARTRSMERAGWPDFRREAAALVDGLPEAHLILIPPALWQEAISRPNQFAMSTLPYHASAAHCLRYEAEVRAHLLPGGPASHRSPPGTSSLHGGRSRPVGKNRGEQVHLFHL